LSVPDEGHSRKESCALNLISTFFFNTTGRSALLYNCLNCTLIQRSMVWDDYSSFHLDWNALVIILVIILVSGYVDLRIVRQLGHLHVLKWCASWKVLKQLKI